MSRAFRRWIREKYKNGSEQAFVDAAKAAGLTITKRGWPDFIVYHPDGRLTLVEVKQKATHNLSFYQAQLAETLQKYGIKTIIWIPGDPLP